jgi:nicotinate-nucleotide adenylyltransferase
MSQRICLFGGTFDPIHCAHLRIAEEGIRAFALDRILFVPAANPPHKDTTGLTPYQDRLRMVEIACSPYSQFEASRLEEEEQRSYTVDTLRKFRWQTGPDAHIFFLIGADAFDEIETWKSWQELVTLTEFIVVARPGRAYRDIPGARVHRLENLSLPISSSTIRERLAAGEPTPELPIAVRRYIEERGLYGFKNKPITASQ